MDLWVLFLLAGIAFAIGEISTLGFFMAPFAIGAFAASILDLVGMPAAVSIIVFFALSGVTFAGLRPVARRHLRQPPSARTGTDALIGQSAIVLERIANDEGVGCVRIGGEVWTARSYDDDRVIEKGEKVQVIEIRGATALVNDI